MKAIHVDKVIAAVEKLCIDANFYLNSDMREGLEKGYEVEESPVGKKVLEQILENADTAGVDKMAICQDTGMTVVFADVGQEVGIVGGSLTEAINEGVRRGYKNGYLRFSVVRDPLDRVNTGDNTPAVIHYNIVEGDELRINLAPKGFGSENMSALKMLKPSDGLEGVKSFILETVEKAGPNPCPPIVVGVGIGGTMEKAAILAKQALLRPINVRNSVEYVKALEGDMLAEINKLGIGRRDLAAE